MLVKDNRRVGTDRTARRGSAGGRANEGGSLHRAGLAAYLAAHGLADVPLRVPEARGLGPPRELALETDDDVDDLECVFAGGWRWQVQAKRECRWDDKFRGALDQCARAARAPGTPRAVIAAGGLSSGLRDLRSALRRPESTGALPTQQRALARLRRDAGAGGWLADLDAVVAETRIVQVRAETAEDADFREAAALLDGTVVEHGAGLRAMEALARFFHTESGASGRSGLEGWLAVLDGAGINPGPSSAAASVGLARRLSAYRAVVGRRLDLLTVEHLAPAPPLPVQGLAGTFRITGRLGDDNRTDGAKLTALARRWPRLAIVGLPGAGKSTALEQLAAQWAGDPDAPLPVVVRLHRLVGPLRDRAALGIDALVAAGDDVPAGLVPEIARRLLEGTAALLLDGLDECHEQQPAAASRIRVLAGQVHPNAGLVVTAREAASESLRATGLPVTTLDEPSDLSSRVRLLARHVAEALGSGDPAAAEAWVARSQAEHRDIWRVPLFAVLLAVQAARRPTRQRPATRAAALRTALQDSVEQWEAVKAHEPGAWAAELHPRLLLDAFAEIAHAAAAGGCDEATAERAVAASCSAGWLLAPAAADATAADAMRWWVDRVGAFNVRDGELQPRLKLLAEVGDAMWAVRRTPDTRRPWVRRALADPDRHREPVLLAASLLPEIIDEIGAQVEGPEAVLLATRCATQAGGALPGTLDRLLDRLDALAAEGVPRRSSGSGALAKAMARRRDGRDGPSWRYTLAAARLPLPVELRPRRAAAVRHARDDEQRLVFDATAAAADCRADGRRPDADELAALRGVLALPVPDPGPRLVHQSRRRVTTVDGRQVCRGRGSAAAAAIELVGLDDQTAPAAVELRMQTPMDEADRLHDAIVKAGYGARISERLRAGGALGALARHFGPDGQRADRFVLEAAARLRDGTGDADGDRTEEPAPAWRMNQLAATLAVLGEGKQSLRDAEMAVDRHPGLVTGLVAMAVRGRGPAVAADARAALRLLDRDPLGTVVLLHLPPPPESEAPGLPDVLAGDVDLLRACLRSRNDWLFWTAAEWLADSPAGRDAMLDELTALAPRHRLAVADWLLETTGRQAVARTWAHGGDPVLRVAAAAVTAGSDDATDGDLLRLAANPDLTIRLAALRAVRRASPERFDALARHAKAAAPDRWTCEDCGAVEDIADLDCTGCPTGSRAEFADELDRLRVPRRAPRDG